MRAQFIFLAALALGGCVSEFKFPVSGQMGDGTPMNGQAVAKLNGEGSFFVAEPGGLRCDGRYDSRNSDPTLIVPVVCTDGTTGEAVITRQMDMMSGTVIARLDDGRTGQFVFGDLSFNQAFGAGAVGTVRN